MSFYSLNIARTGLYASQKNLDVTAHNIANADTEGYTRQRLEQSSIPGVAYGEVSVGGGVRMDKLTQLRNKYLDSQYRYENSQSSMLDTKKDALEYIEGVMSEPTDFGINQALTDLFKSVESLGNNAHELSHREIVVQNAVKLCDTIRTIAGNLVTYQAEVDRNIALKTDEVNMFAEEIASLNKTIFAYEANGQQANDLRDQRNLLVDKLSALVPVQTQENEQGKFSVRINGISLVNDVYVEKVEMRDSATVNPFTGDLVKVMYWEGSSTEVNLDQGEIKGLMDIRDGATQESQGVPFYVEELNTLARNIIDGFNNVNHNGYTIPNNGNPSQTGIDFFDSDPANYSALKIRVSDELIESGFNIAASKDQLFGEVNWGNNENIIEFNEMRHSSNIEERLQGIISNVAINTNYYASRSSSQRVLTDHIQSQKLSITEVSIDEESSNLVQFQHSYGASAKMISVIDDMLNTLLNLR